MLCGTEKDSTTKRINTVFNYNMKRLIYVLSNHEVKHLSLLDGRTTCVTAHLFAQFFTSYAERFRPAIRKVCTCRPAYHRSSGSSSTVEPGETERPRTVFVCQQTIVQHMRACVCVYA